MTNHQHTQVDPIEGSRTFLGMDKDCPFCKEREAQLEQTTFNQEVAVDQIVRDALTKPERLGQIQIWLEEAYREGYLAATGGWPYSKEANAHWAKSRAFQVMGQISRLMR